MSAEDIARALRGAASRLRSAAQDLEQILAAPGEFPAARRQPLEAIDDDVAVAARLIHKALGALR
jgi:hypothetical protein